MVYYQLDHLGTPIAAHNAKGEAVWTAEYEAWGRIRNETVSDGLKANIPFRFQGQYYDEESGLHYNRFRYYDPEIGRFVSQDPIGLKGGGNLYAYVVNPTLWIDPLGLDHRSVFWNAVKHDTHRDKYQVHHIFPKELFKGKGNNLRASQILKCHNIAKDGIDNLIGLPKNENDNPRKNEHWFGASQHNSNHYAYTDILRNAIEKIGSSGSCREQKLKLIALQRGARTALKRGVPLMKGSGSTALNWESVLKSLY